MRVSLPRLAALAAMAALLIACANSTALGSAAAAAPAATRPHWSSATLVPGVGGDWSEPFSVSCTGPGDCTAGGNYGPDEPYTQSLPFVVTEVGGTWGAAKTVTGIPVLGADQSEQYAAVTSVSCAWPGNCAAVGYYLTRWAGFTGQAFAVNEVNGAWQRTHPLAGVTGRENVNALGADWAITVSCAPATTRAAREAGLNCLAVGSDRTHGHQQGFVAQARHGSWGAGQLVDGLARLGGTRPSQVNAVSCAAPGACAIGGYYTDGNGRREAFADAQADGGWHPASEVPGTSALNAKGSAEVDAVDCPAPGNCAAAGDYRSKDGAAEFFVVKAAWATWHAAIEVPGLARLGNGADLAGAPIAELSCAQASCEVGGTVNAKAAGGTSGFLIGETRGRWSAPHLVPGASSAVTALSCPTAGNCAVGGTAGHSGLPVHGIALDQVNGVWGTPVTVAPDTQGVAAGMVTALSCAAARHCAAVGFLPDGGEAGPRTAVATEGQP